MIKTPEQFLEGLKIFVREHSMKADYPFEGEVIYAQDIIDSIESFQQEQNTNEKK